MKSGLKLEGKVRVFSKTKDFTGKNKVKYSITDHWFTVGEKLENGEWDNRSMNLFFRKDTETPNHNTDIIIKDSWFFLTGEGKYKRISIFVNEWEYGE